MMRARLAGATLALALLVVPQVGSAQTVPPKTAADPVAAVVNGTEIKRSDIELLYRSLPPQYQQIPMDAIYNQLVDRYVDQRLMADAARKEGIENRPGVKRQIALAADGLLTQAYMDERLRTEVTEDRLHEAYQKKIALEPKREEVHARHILVKTKEEAEAIIAELKGGADFADLARKKSTGPSARTGGDLGFFTREQMVPAFSKVAFALKPGEFTTRPVHTQFGWHVIKVEERRVAGARPFEEVEGELRESLSEQAYKRVVADLRSKAKVEIRNGSGGIQPVR